MSTEANKKSSVPKGSDRCMHITEKEERCKNKRHNNTEYCHVHNNPKQILTSGTNVTRKNENDEKKIKDKTSKKERV